MTPEMQSRMNILSNMMRNPDQENEFRDLSNQFALSQGQPLPYPEQPTTPVAEEVTTESAPDQTPVEVAEEAPQTEWTPETPAEGQEPEQATESETAPEIPVVGSSEEGVENAPEVDAAIADDTQLTGVEELPQEEVTPEEPAAPIEEVQPVEEVNVTPDPTHPLVQQRSALQTLLDQLEQILTSDASLAIKEVAMLRTKLEEGAHWLEAALKRLGL